MTRRSAAIVLKDEQILLMYKRSFRSEVYYLPGGTIEYKEQPHDAVVRELFEETGLIIKEAELIFEHRHLDLLEGINNYGYYFHIKKFEGEPVLYANGDHYDLKKLEKVKIKNHRKLVWVKISDLHFINIKPREIIHKIRKNI